jgi:hypothetical protein
MTSNQDAAISTPSRAWFFEELAHEKMIRAIEPDGTEHLVHLGDMNSAAGIALLNAMTRALTRKP